MYDNQLKRFGEAIELALREVVSKLQCD